MRPRCSQEAPGSASDIEQSTARNLPSAKQLAVIPLDPVYFEDVPKYVVIGIPVATWVGYWMEEPDIALQACV
jgi:hypothetical protein